MARKEMESIDVTLNYSIFMDGGKSFFKCSACDTSNVLADGEKDAHFMSNLIRHQETTQHQYSLQVLSGKMGKDNPVICKLFEEIENDVGQNLFMLGEASVACRSCKNVKISLVARGSALQRVKAHMNSKEHKQNNKAEFQKIKDISSFFMPTTKKS